MMTGMKRTTVLFGAFDRHNFGDLLFPHVLGALLPGENIVCAGLAERDLRPWGGHRVRAWHALRDELKGAEVHLLHAGGELLTCSAWQAAVMLLSPEDAPAHIAYLERHPQEQAAWMQHMTGSGAQAPYVMGRSRWPELASVGFHAVGGVGLPNLPAPMRAEVLASLQSANRVSVRDQTSQTHLQAAGLTAELVPDAAVLVAELFGTTIGQHAAQGEVLRLRQAMPQGYLAVQFSAAFGDDTTVATLAAQLDELAASTGLGTVLFRAGAAPWHDDLALLQRVAARMASPHVRVVESLHLWDIAALIASSQGYCGNSLHGRIVAIAYALPRVGLALAHAGIGAKQSAFAHTWEPAGQPDMASVNDLAQTMLRALAVTPETRRTVAASLAEAHRQGSGLVTPGGVDSRPCS